MTRCDMARLQEGDRVRGLWREPDGTGETMGGSVYYVSAGLGWIEVEWDNQTISVVTSPRSEFFELHREGRR